MVKLFLQALFLMAAGAASAQHVIKSEDIGHFNGVSITGNITAEIAHSDVNRLEVQLFDVETNKFKWGLRNGILFAEVNSGQKGKGRVEMKIYAADTLGSVSVSGGSLVMRETLNGEMFELNVNGGGKATVDLLSDAFDMDVSVTGNSVAVLSGAARYLTLHATEKSRVDAKALESVAADVTTATGAEATVNVQERLVANAKTVSTIFYKGRPRLIRDKTTKMNSGIMGSSIQHIGE